MTKAQTILIVEDDEWLAAQHERMLIAEGYATRAVGNALAAMDMIDDERPDAVVLDVLLAGPNAFTLLHELQSHTDLAGIPVILCTNSADQLSRGDLEAYGVCQVLDKATMYPVDVLTAVKKALL